MSDDNYKDWKPGDILQWEDVLNADDSEIIVLDHIDGYERVFWTDSEGKQCMTRACNMIRIRLGVKCWGG